MIVISTLNFLVALLLNVVTFWLPDVNFLPYNINVYVADGFGYVHGFLNVFWPFQPVWNVFMLYVYLQFSFICLRFILGHRSPNLRDAKGVAGIE